MLASLVVISVVSGGLSALASVLAGHEPLAWLLHYMLAGMIAALLVILGSIPRPMPEQEAP